MTDKQIIIDEQMENLNNLATQQLKRIEEEKKQIEHIAKTHLVETFDMQREIDKLKKELQAKEQECERLNRWLPIVIRLEEQFRSQEKAKGIDYQTYAEHIFAELDQLKAENEELKKQLMQKSEVDMFFNTPIEGWSNDPCEICPHKAENEQLKEELSTIQHNCNREGCRYYDDNTFKVFYECKAQKALQLSANSVTTKYCDLLQTLTEIKVLSQEVYKLTNRLNRDMALFAKEIIQKISEVENE